MELAVGAASSVVSRLANLLAEEANQVLGVRREIPMLQTTLRHLRSFLEDAERRPIRNSAAMDLWLREVKDVMYDADDIVDLCHIMGAAVDPSLSTPTPESTSGCWCISTFRNLAVAHDIGGKIKGLHRRLEDLEKMRSRFEFIPQATNEGSDYLSRETDPFIIHSDIVGEKTVEDANNIVGLLINKDDTVESMGDKVVVAVTGMAGIGKTTLAKLVYNNTMVAEHFDNRVWLSVGQEPSDINLLQRILASAGAKHEAFEGNKELLFRALMHVFRGKRFLLVLDQVWDEKVWNELLRGPLSYASHGSRVLVTTRNERVARGMRAHHIHRVEILETQDAWILLKKQILLLEAYYKDIDGLKDIGTEIIRRCSGLPFAIKVVGGILRNKPRTRDSWLVVLNDHYASQLFDSDIYNCLYLSYMELKPQLKQCFLYCSLLPKGHFNNTEIINMWISEGLIQLEAESSDELEDIGTNYHQELIMRNLIEPCEPGILSFNMHDIVRSFAQYMARHEALIVQREQKIEITSHLLSKFRRLFIESTESIPVEWAVLKKQVPLRVLIIINYRTINFKHGHSLSNFSSLRVLHIERLADSDRLVSSLCQLKHLRYLYLCDSDISRLPDDIDRMRFLQHIGIVNCEKFVQLPVNIIRLRQLRSLDLVGSSVNVVPRGFSQLTNLRSLLGFPAHTSDEGPGCCNLGQLAPLCQLRSLRLEGIEKVGDSYLAAEAEIFRKEHLKSLHLTCSNSSTSRAANVSNSEQLLQEVYGHLSPPPCLETLVMEGYIERRLPNWMWAREAEIFNRLSYMALHKLARCTQLPDGLCKMPCLEILKINEAPLIEHVGPEFLYHDGLGCAFPRLQKLFLDGMVEWCKWEWDPSSGVQAMPVLEVLHVESCKLKRLPPGLSDHAWALRHLVITGARLLESLENFSCLAELHIYFSPELNRISDLPSLQKLTIKICPKLRVLEGVPSLRSLVVEDYTMKTLPGYFKDVCPRYLTLDCTIKLLKTISMQDDDSEWQKIRHIQHVKAYAEDGGYQRKCYVLYTREPYSFEAMLDSEENLTDDNLVNSDIPSGSTGVDLSNNDSELVGIERPHKEIIKMLMHGHDLGKKQLQVVSICGIGGLGKTSIANAVYKQIEDKFTCCAFVQVTERPVDNEGIIKDIFDEVRCPYPSLEEGVIQQPVDQLIDKLKEFLQDKRYLIVLDNIWDVSVWETIKPALIDNNHGSGIITTTCKVDVAESIGGVYKLPLLSEDHSKKLFYRGTYFGSEDSCPSEYRELSKRMLNKCGHLPLAIITITSLLPPNRLSSPEEWENVCDSIGSKFELGDRVRSMRKTLSRSYYDLPEHLRTCFLYLSIFPEHYVIRRDSLVQRWLSEGFIGGNHGQNLRELGEGYFYQLLDTGLIQPIEHDNDGKALTCWVPGLMIDLIFSLMEEEKRSLQKQIEEKCARQKEIEENGALEQGTEEMRSLEKEIEALKKQIEEKHATTPAGKRRTDPSRIERLSVQVSKEQHDAAKETKPLGAMAGAISSSRKEKSFCQGSLSISCSADSMITPPVCKNLRVLVLEGSLKEAYIPKCLQMFSRLEYLILASTQITKISKKVGNLRFLRTLDLRATSVHELPCTFVGLKLLRCLLINRSTKVPAGISNLQDLEELQDIDISKSQDILEDICTLPKLTILKVALESWDESSSTLLSKTLRKLSMTKLKHLSISTCCLVDLQTGNDKQNEVFQHIEKLEIQHSMFDRLPTWIDKLQKLSNLSIEVYLLEKDALQILGRLPDLVFLSLTAKKTPEEGADTEDKLVVGSNTFARLKTFHLFSRAIWIKFEQGSMTKLETLKLSFQASIRADDFSFGVENLSSLKYVQVEIICINATKKAVEKAEYAIRDMIWVCPKQPKPALDIRRSAEEYMIEEKRDPREEMRDLIRASWVKKKQKQMNV